MVPVGGLKEEASQQQVNKISVSEDIWQEQLSIALEGITGDFSHRSCCKNFFWILQK